MKDQEDSKQDEPLMKASHQGKLTIAGFEIGCYVIESGEGNVRILSRQGVLKALGRNEKPTRVRETVDELPNFLRAANLKQFISSELTESTKPIHFITPTGQKAIGYRADILSAICYVFIDANKAGALKAQQIHIAEQCELLVRGFASVGLRALVDEATGFQEVRPKDDLQRYLDAFLLKEHAKWAKRFPDEFFRLLFEMMSWTWSELSSKRTPYIGKMINNLVYERLAPLVLEELRIKNPPNDKGQRKVKHHQFLTPEIGHPKLQEHIYALMALLKASGLDRARFEDMVNIALPRHGQTIPIQFGTLSQPAPVLAKGFDKSLKGLLSVPPPQKDKPDDNK